MPTLEIRQAGSDDRAMDAQKTIPGVQNLKINTIHRRPIVVGDSDTVRDSQTVPVPNPILGRQATVSTFLNVDVIEKVSLICTFDPVTSTVGGDLASLSYEDYLPNLLKAVEISTGGTRLTKLTNLGFQVPMKILERTREECLCLDSQEKSGNSVAARVALLAAGFTVVYDLSQLFFFTKHKSQSLLGFLIKGQHIIQLTFGSISENLNWTGAGAPAGTVGWTFAADLLFEGQKCTDSMLKLLESTAAALPDPSLPIPKMIASMPGHVQKAIDFEQVQVHDFAAGLTKLSCPLTQFTGLSDGLLVICQTNSGAAPAPQLDLAWHHRFMEAVVRPGWIEIAKTSNDLFTKTRVDQLLNVDFPSQWPLRITGYNWVYLTPSSLPAQHHTHILGAWNCLYMQDAYVNLYFDAATATAMRVTIFNVRHTFIRYKDDGTGFYRLEEVQSSLADTAQKNNI